MRRREASAALLMGLAAGPLVVSANGLPAAVLTEVPALQRRGSGAFRRWGFLVYEATLWADERDPLQPPLALGLVYQRQIEGEAIARASVDEMRRLGASESDLRRWGERLRALFPNVRAGDQLLGVHWPDRARFYFNGQAIGEVEDAAFAQAFFAIWLDPRTSEPGLRTALIGRAG
jgi:hypothetical protein